MNIIFALVVSYGTGSTKAHSEKISAVDFTIVNSNCISVQRFMNTAICFNPDNMH